MFIPVIVPLLPLLWPRYLLCPQGFHSLPLFLPALWLHVFSHHFSWSVLVLPHFPYVDVASLSKHCLWLKFYSAFLQYPCSQIQILPCPINGSYFCLMPQVTSSQPVCRTSAQSIPLTAFFLLKILFQECSLFFSIVTAMAHLIYFFFLHFSPPVVGCYCQIHLWNCKLESGKSYSLISENSDSNPGRKVALMLWSLTL